MYITDFRQEISSALGGGKAASLSRMVQVGVAVPAGFVLTKHALSVYWKEGSLGTQLRADLHAALSDLKAEQLIVRSSAIGEDSDEHSFAGQLDSIVVKNNSEEVLSAIYSCWDGMSNERLKAYEDMSGKRLTEMAVVVQEYIDADYAGVSFSQSPLEPGKMYTEFVQGAGEQLVAGKVTPSQVSADMQDAKLDTPFSSESLMTGLRKLVAAYQQDLDVEWVVKNDQLYFVQARPITVKSKRKVYWSNTNLNENYPDPISPLLYSIARDSYYHYFKNLAKLVGTSNDKVSELEYSFSNTVGIWGNRLYYNMSSIHNIMSSSALHSYFKSAFNQFVGYQDKDVANDTQSAKSSLFRIVVRLIGLNFRLNKNVRIIEQKVSSYTLQLKSAKGDHELKDSFYQFLDLRFNQWYHASLADMFSMIHYKTLGSFTKRFYGEKSVGVHNTLIQAIPGLISSEPLNVIYDLVTLINSNPDYNELFVTKSNTEVFRQIQSNRSFSELKLAVDSYLEDWGFRCSGELMFFKKNYVQEPAEFILLVQTYMKNNAKDPRKVIRQKSAERIKARRRFALKIIKRRHILFPLTIIELGMLYLSTSLCKNAIASRERVRYKQAEMYFGMKQTVLALGEQLAEKGTLEKKEDLFYLTYKEIGELLSSSSMFAHTISQSIEQRKRDFELESEKEFPQDFSTNFGERPLKVDTLLTDFESKEYFTGLAASGGQIRAKVKVLESVLESEKLEEGDILITRQTDPGWAMVFPIIGGLIVEKGGALSHGAIVAREFGIPAVIGIPGIVEQFKDGDEVLLDGDLGEIYKL